MTLARAPLLVVAGFLGAGKTTFLRRLVPALASRGLRARVILNDYKDARIDAATLADLVPDLVALSGSCVCCESLEDLLALLGQMRPAPGDVVVLEANGGTETSELLSQLAGAALPHLTPPLQLTVVDSRRFGDRGWQNTMEREQLETATHLYSSRRDQVGPERLAEVRRVVAGLAPAAAWVDPESLADLLVPIEAAARAAASDRPQKTQDHDHDHKDHDHSQHHDHDHSQHHDHDHGREDQAVHPFAAYVVELPFPVHAAAFEKCLAELPPDVLRAKGIVILRDPEGEKRSFQKVAEEVEISPCQLAEPETLAPRAVFIGPRLPIALIEERLARLRTSS